MSNESTQANSHPDMSVWSCLLSAPAAPSLTYTEVVNTISTSGEAAGRESPPRSTATGVKCDGGITALYFAEAETTPGRVIVVVLASMGRLNHLKSHESTIP